MAKTTSEKILNAIQKINPTAKVIVGDSLDKITWLDGTTPISKADIKVKYDEIIADETAKDYINKRLEEYPHWLDCLHALLDGGDTLTELQAKRTAIKNKYPKE